MKKCLNNKVNHKNLDLSCFFQKLDKSDKKCLKVISDFASAPCTKKKPKTKQNKIKNNLKKKKPQKI